MLNLSPHRMLVVEQVFEIGELLGFETRNKYRISDAASQTVAYAAEERSGILGFLGRNALGHWRNFNILFFNPDRQLVMTARHPFRFFFQRLEINDAQGRPLGAIQRRFSLLTKRFDVEDAQGQTLFEVASPIWKIWTFPFTANGQEVAVVKKKWAGVLTEAFTDRDRFAVEYGTDSLGNSERHLILAAAVFIDLQYFEVKSGNN